MRNPRVACAALAYCQCRPSSFTSTYPPTHPPTASTSLQLALDAVREGMCVVIGLQSTGEANTTAVSWLPTSCL
jgi:hypothetical protein